LDGDRTDLGCALATRRSVETEQGLTEEARLVLGAKDPLLGHVIPVVDRLDRTTRFTRATADTHNRVDAVDRTHLHAGAVLMSTQGNAIT
jgi:hypothetical protein